MSLCGNRLPISGECLLGCGGFGGCKQGHEDSIKPRSNLFNPLTGEPYPSPSTAETAPPVTYPPLAR
jgi:hypothetical protein